MSDRTLFRGGVFKPRSNAYSFRGLGEEGLEHLAEAKRRTGLPIVTEIMGARDIELFMDYGVDMFQVGARNWQNQELLVELGKTNTPVLYKRGMYAPIEEWLSMAEFIAKEGNKNIVLCERGLSNKISGNHHRNSIDFDVVAGVKERTILPIIIDPSHGTGVKEYVRPASMAAIQCYGADGLEIEVIGDNTDRASIKCDAAQGIRLKEYAKLLDGLEGRMA